MLEPHPVYDLVCAFTGIWRFAGALFSIESAGEVDQGGNCGCG
jgi:hypothetical protein